MKLYNIITVWCLCILFGTVCAMAPECKDTPMDDSSYLTLVCTNGTRINVLRQLWGQFFSQTSTRPLDRQLAQFIIDLIGLASTQEHARDKAYTDTGALAHMLIENRHIDALELLDSYCSLQPDIGHPLTHLIAWHAARSIYANRGTREIQDTLGRLRAAGASYAALPLMYFYFQMSLGERIGFEQLIFDNFPVEIIDVFFSNKPLPTLARSACNFVETIKSMAQTDLAGQKKIMPPLVYELINQDNPLLLRYTQVLQRRNGITFRFNRYAGIYYVFKKSLYDCSVAATYAMIKVFRLNPNHLFEEYEFEKTSHAVGNSTPLLIAIMRGEPLLVAALLDAGALPGMLLTRPDGTTITPLALAKSIIDPAYAEANVMARSKPGVEVWYTPRDDENIQAQNAIIALLTRPQPETIAVPRMLITPIDSSISSELSTSGLTQDQHYLNAPSQPLSPRFARRNAIAPALQLLFGRDQRVAQSSADEESQELLLRQTPITYGMVDDFGCGCGCSASKNTRSKKSKACAIM